jgi:hypothetical protein
MKTRALAAALAALAVAGCGGTQNAAPPTAAPKLPRALAQAWAQQAEQVAVAIDEGDGCTARQRAATLRSQVVDAVNAHRVPRRYLEQLVSTTNDLAGRITCTPPPAPVVARPAKHEHPKPPKPPKPHGHDKHGKHGGH